MLPADGAMPEEDTASLVQPDRGKDTARLLDDPHVKELLGVIEASSEMWKFVTTHAALPEGLSLKLVSSKLGCTHVAIHRL